MDIEKAIKYKIKNEQSAYQFMIFLENNGIGTRAAAKLRIDKPGLFWGSGKVTDERNFEKEMVHELLGAPVDYRLARTAEGWRRRNTRVHVGHCQVCYVACEAFYHSTNATFG